MSNPCHKTQPGLQVKQDEAGSRQGQAHKILDTYLPEFTFSFPFWILALDFKLGIRLGLGLGIGLVYLINLFATA